MQLLTDHKPTGGIRVYGAYQASRIIEIKTVPQVHRLCIGWLQVEGTNNLANPLDFSRISNFQSIRANSTFQLVIKPLLIEPNARYNVHRDDAYFHCRVLRAKALR